MHYLYSILVFIGMVVFGAAAIGLLMLSSKEKDKKKSDEYNPAIIICLALAVGGFFYGRHLWNDNGTQSAAPSVNSTITSTNAPDPQNTNESVSNNVTNNTDNASSTNTSKFSVENPVPNSYLKDFLSSMDTIYKYMHTKAHSGEAYDQGGWEAYLGMQNRDGFEKYNNINYQTGSRESEEQSQKRIDVEHAWIYLSSLGMDYDLFLSGKSSKTATDIQREEAQYEQVFKKALDDLK